MKHIKNKKRISDKQYVKDYKGEESPYHQYMTNVIAAKDGAHKGGTKEYEEFPEANPDVLCESDGLWYIRTDVNEEQLEMVQKAISYLTDKQKIVLQMVGYEGKTLENVGAILGISKGNVADLLKRARKIIKSKCKNL
jgi:RNA polymerase sigma factor (sigma-70 family)